MADYIYGNVDDDSNAAEITRLIIAGNSISHEVANKEHHYKVSVTPELTK